MNKSSITIVVPFFNEYENLLYFPERIKEIKLKLKYDVKFLFVDDGSTDLSLELIKSWKIDFVDYLSFSQNYGSHIAILAATEFSNTNYFTFMSADMQEPVSLYEDLLTKSLTSNADIILAKRINRADNTLNKLFSKIYNSLVKNFAFRDFPQNGVDIVLITKRIVDIIKNIKEKNTSFYGLLFTLGFQKEYVQYIQYKREHGKSKWSLKKKVKLLIDTFVSFTLLPLRLITFTGLSLFILSLCFGLYLVLRTIIFGIAIPGYVTLALLITGGFGCNFLFLGIFSEYLWRLVDQVRPRPSFIIKESSFPLS
jgi:dolichol-phosphate mannosyltransferase